MRYWNTLCLRDLQVHKMLLNGIKTHEKLQTQPRQRRQWQHISVKARFQLQQKKLQRSVEPYGMYECYQFSRPVRLICEFQHTRGECWEFLLHTCGLHDLTLKWYGALGLLLQCCTNRIAANPLYAHRSCN